MDLTRTVVLGGGGFIGSRLVERLVQMGHSPIAVDTQWVSEREQYLNGADRMTLDLTDPSAASIAVDGATMVFHFAADMGGVGWFHSDRDWQSSLTNGRITTNVLEAAARKGIPRLFYASSACAAATEPQGNADAPYAITEHDLSWGTPDALYGAEKRHGAWLCSHAPIDCRVGVFHTIYGPGQEHEGPRMKFPPAVAMKAIAARQSGVLEVWGDGTQQRSYLFIDDAIDRILTLAAAPENPGPVNIGSPHSIPCQDIARTCLALTGADAEIVNVDGPTGVMGRNADLTKWRALFGDVSHTTYSDGFAQLIAWLEEVTNGPVHDD
jgi:GDP-D-mannose 3',5'-epimerase